MTRLFRTSSWTWPTIAIVPCVFGPGMRSKSSASARLFRFSRLGSSRTPAISAAPCADILEETISLLKENPTPATGESGPTAEQAKTIADLESQAADLELKSKELRTKIAALKPKAGPNAQGTNGASSTASVTELESE